MTKQVAPIAQAARAAGALDRAALDAALTALDFAQQWTRDTCESTRARARAYAATAQALALSDAANVSLTRQALAGYGAALALFLDCKYAPALQAARGARFTLFA